MALDLSIVGQESAPSTYSYGWKDTVLYALGIGAKKAELDYLYEGRGPKVIPSFAVVPMFPAMLERLVALKGDLAMIVHGAQRVRLHAPIAKEGSLTTVAKVRGVYDLRRFAVVMVDVEGRDAGGKLVFDSASQIIWRDAGGFGGTTQPKEPKVADIPKGQAADFRVEETTSPEQALLYRLSGDHNPLHADPAFAERVGFPQGPILHGLCSYGYMVRHAVQGLGIDMERVTGFESKFTKPVWPGDTFVTEGWKVADGTVALQVSVKERSEVALSGAWLTYR